MNVLFWSEPHPLRNTFTEHLHWAKTLVPVLLDHVRAGEISLRVFSNNVVVDLLADAIPIEDGILVAPTPAEHLQIEALYRQWDDAAISEWLNLVRGEGEITDFYSSILARLNAQAPIDVILTWSENGAVRRFAKQHETPVLFGELGPTRTPFIQTMYFDSQGTNGNAAFRAKARPLIEKAFEKQDTILPTQIWQLATDRANPDKENQPTLIDLATTFDPECQALLPPEPYIFVPLQLADDLNTLINAPFDGPLTFLQEVSRIASDLGYALVVKGHPGASARPYNLRREIEALDWLQDAMPDAIVLDRKCGPKMSLYAIARAAYTVTINSSVGFESMMLGVPTIVMGDAAFDADGWLQEHVTLRPSGELSQCNAEMNAVVSAYMRHILVPVDIVLTTDYLLRQLIALVENQPIDISTIDFSARHIQGELSYGDAGVGTNTQSLYALRQCGVGSEVTVTRNKLILKGPTLEENMAFELEPFCKGYIDAIKSLGGGRYRLVGWAIDARNHRRPTMVTILNGHRISAHGSISSSREDVIRAQGKKTVSKWCGFDFAFNANDLSRLQIIIWSSDGKGHLISKVPQNLTKPFSIERASKKFLGRWVA